MKSFQLSTIVTSAILALGVALPTAGAELKGKKYPITLTVTGSAHYDTQVGQDSGWPKYLSIVLDKHSSELLSSRLHGNFTGLVVVTNDAWVMKQLKVSAECESFAVDRIKISLNSFWHPVPFDQDADWVEAKAVAVQSFSKPKVERKCNMPNSTIDTGATPRSS